MENPFAGHHYPTETLLSAVNMLLGEIDKGYFGNQFQVGDSESIYLVSVREAAERENHFNRLRDEAAQAKAQPEVQF
jgi:hypothetical protein